MRPQPSWFSRNCKQLVLTEVSAYVMQCPPEVASPRCSEDDVRGHARVRICQPKLRKRVFLTTTITIPLESGLPLHAIINTVLWRVREQTRAHL